MLCILVLQNGSNKNDFVCIKTCDFDEVILNSVDKL